MYPPVPLRSTRIGHGAQIPWQEQLNPLPKHEQFGSKGIHRGFPPHYEYVMQLPLERSAIGGPQEAGDPSQDALYGLQGDSNTHNIWSWSRRRGEGGQTPPFPVLP